MSKLPSSGTRDVLVDAVNGVYEIKQLENKLEAEKKLYGLTDDEVQALRAAYLREEQNPLEQMFQRGVQNGLAVFGVERPVYRSSKEILDTARARRPEK